MPTSDTCNIRVDLALALVDTMRAVGASPSDGHFRCPECGEPVRPHRSAEPHFEHLERNPDCPLRG